MLFARNPAEPDDPNSSILNPNKLGNWCWAKDSKRQIMVDFPLPPSVDFF